MERKVRCKCRGKRKDEEEFVPRIVDVEEEKVRRLGEMEQKKDSGKQRRLQDW